MDYAEYSAEIRPKILINLRKLTLLIKVVWNDIQNAHMLKHSSPMVPEEIRWMYHSLIGDIDLTRQRIDDLLWRLKPSKVNELVKENHSKSKTKEYFEIIDAVTLEGISPGDFRSIANETIISTSNFIQRLNAAGEVELPESARVFLHMQIGTSLGDITCLFDHFFRYRRQVVEGVSVFDWAGSD